MPATAAAVPPVNNLTRLYSLDGWGGVHSAGVSPALKTSAYWYQWDIARGMALFNDGTGGYVLDGWGGVHQVGLAPAVAASGYWQDWDIARAVVTAPWATAVNPAGWTLDGWGGLHGFGSAPALQTTAYWQGWDIARGVVVFGDSTPTSVRGYVLDGWGGLHGFAGGSATLPPPATVTGYWQGMDIARSVSLVNGSQVGYVMDGYGGVHAFAPAGTALPPAVADGAHAYWNGWDIARGLTMWTSAPGAAPGGWIMDGWGGFHAFGSAPAVQGSAYWPGWDIAKAGAGAGSGSGSRPPPITSRFLDIPYSQQVYSLSCEEAALQMALASRGINVSQGQVLATMGIDYRSAYRDAGGNLHWGDPYASFVGDPNGSETNLTGYGSYNEAIYRAAGALGGQVVMVAEGYSPGQLYQQVLNGHPVVAWTSFDYRYHGTTFYSAFDGRTVRFGAPFEHAVTIGGVTPDSVYVLDPWNGPGWMSKGRFEAGYASFNDMAVVIN